MTLQVTVADVHQMTPDVKQFRLVADDHTFDYRPGQHTQIHFELDGAERSEGPSKDERGGRTASRTRTARGSNVPTPPPACRGRTR